MALARFTVRAKQNDGAFPGSESRPPSGPGRASVLLGALTEGSFFGEISTLSGRPRTATITAAAPCEILELDRAGLDAVSAAHPRVRDVLEAFSAARSSDPEAARARGGQA